MKKLPFPSLVCGAWTLGLVLGCTGQVGTGVSNPTGTGGAGGVGSGTGGAGVGAGTGGMGTNTGTGGVGTSTGGVGVGSGGAASAADPNAAGPRPLRLLTRREYANTIRDLLGDTSTQPGSLPSEDEDSASGFAFHTTGSVATQDATLLRDAAEALAKIAAAPAKLNTLVPCAAMATSAATETTCLTTFLGPSGLAMKMYRRPLSTADVTRLMALYTTGRAAPLSLNFAGAIGLVIEAVLQSPEFLYHWELDPTPAVREGTVVKLGNYEVANRLSYFVWGTMPDAALFTAASAGQLGDAASIEAQVRRMLKDPKATTLPTGATGTLPASGTLPLFADFFTDWLDLDTLSDKPKDPALYPTYDDALIAAMAGEVQRFAHTILITGTGRFDELLTGTASFANQALATLYGITGVTGTALAAVSLPGAQRAGVLTSAGFMSVTGASGGSDPPRRGKALYEKLLCGTLPPPPPVVPPVKDAAAGGTTRQRFEEHVMSPCATACHSIIDPLGFAFENYDGIGRYRTTDNNLPVNAGVTVTLDGQPHIVADARGLAAALATSGQAQACFARQWFQYALGRKDTAQDLASINAAVATFRDSTRDVRELVVALATSRTFRYRTPGTGEVLP